MKFNFFIFLFFIISTSNAQSIIGKWKTIDDVSGKEKSVIEIYEEKGKYFGRIIDIIDQTKKQSKYEKCEGEDKNKPILGLVIIKGLKKQGKIYEGADILDPNNGKTYNCKIELIEKDKINVRGYIGISLFGRSQNWIRVK